MTGRSDAVNFLYRHKIAVSIALIVVLVSASAGNIAFSTLSNPTVATYNNLAGTRNCSFLINTDNTNTYAQSCNTGAISFSGTSAATVIQSAISTTNSAGGGIIKLNSGTYNIASSLTLANSTQLIGQGESTVLLWTGGASSNIISSPVNKIIVGGGISSLVLDANHVSTVTPIYLHSPQMSILRDLEIKNTATSGTAALRIEADAPYYNVPPLKQNALSNHIENVKFFNIQTGVQLLGADNNRIATLNYFSNIQMYNVSGIGIRFVQWTDNNYFRGVEINLISNSAKGIVYNDSATPGSEVGVYANNFDSLAIDAYSLTTAKGIVFNAAKQIMIRGFFHSPEIFGGTLIDDSAGRAISYYIENNQRNGADNNMQILTKGCTCGTNSTSATPSNPTNTTSTTAVMAGLGQIYTPQSTGRLLIIVSMQATNIVGGDGGGTRIKYGTGAAPANGAANTGTACGNEVDYTVAAGSQALPITVSCVATGLTVGTPYWIDVFEKAITGGTAKFTQVTVSITEV